MLSDLRHVKHLANTPNKFRFQKPSKMNLFRVQTRSINPTRKLMNPTLKQYKLDTKLDRFEINQRFSVYERRKGAPALENNSGSW